MTALTIFASDEIDAVYLTSSQHAHHLPAQSTSGGQARSGVREVHYAQPRLSCLEAEELARQNGVQLSWTPAPFLHMPLYKELVSRMEAGEFGPVNLIQEFGSYKEFDMENRFFNPKFAGGACWMASIR